MPLLKISVKLAAPVICGVLLSSCGSTGGGGSGGADEVASAASEPASKKTKTLEDFQFKKGTDVIYGKPGTDEEGMIVGGRRSQYEGKRQGTFGGEYKGGQFKTSNYNAGKWDGTKDFGRQSYSGNTQAGGHLTAASSMDGSTNRNAQKGSGYGQNVYGTNSYRTATAREGGAPVVQRSASHYDDDKLPMPRIMSERDYQKMTIDETNALLGRSR